MYSAALKNRQLLSIGREEISENDIQGFLLGYSDSLVLIEYIYDFNVDGLMVLRREDISSIGSSKTDLFQHRILEEEGSVDKIRFGIDCNLNSIPEFLLSMNLEGKFIAVEEENESNPLFYLGVLNGVYGESLKLQEVNGAGNWGEEETEVFFEDVSCIQMDNKYLNTYERYLAMTD